MDEIANTTSMLLGIGLGLLVGAVLAVFVGALFLRLATRIVEGFSPGYGRACLISLAAMLASAATSFVIGTVIAMAIAPPAPGTSNTSGAALGAVLLLACSSLFGFLINAGAIHLLLKRPDGSGLSLGRSCLIGLLQMAFGLVAYALLAAVLIGLAVLIPALAGAS